MAMSEDIVQRTIILLCMQLGLSPFNQTLFTIDACPCHILLMVFVNSIESILNVDEYILWVIRVLLVCKIQIWQFGVFY